MVRIGPTSSVFDITTYLLMFFLVCPLVAGAPFDQITDPAMLAPFVATFQAGWFVESMWTQTLVIHMIRTPKIPFLQSRASKPVTVLTLAGIALLTCIPFSPLAGPLGLAPLPPVYFALLLVTVACYMALVDRGEAPLRQALRQLALAQGGALPRCQGARRHGALCASTPIAASAQSFPTARARLWCRGGRRRAALPGRRSAV